MPATLKDIAERVGKSVPTVSRALGGFDDVSETTRREVERVAAELGYIPNAAARNLQGQSSRAIALLLPLHRNLRFSDPFFSEFLAGLTAEASARDYDLSIVADRGHQEDQLYRKYFQSRRAAGFVIVRTERQDGRVAALTAANVPFVAFGRVDGNGSHYFVDEDDEAGIRVVVDYLVRLGHRRLGFVAEPTRYTKAYHRLQGFLNGLAANGLEARPEWIVETNYRQLSGYLAGSRLLGEEVRPTAVVASNDLLALGVAQAARERGLAIGQDVSITGYDDIVLAEHVFPTLTSVRQPAQLLGAMVAELLIRRLNGDQIEEKQILLAPELVVRDSTGPPAH